MLDHCSHISQAVLLIILTATESTEGSAGGLEEPPGGTEPSGAYQK